MQFVEDLYVDRTWFYIKKGDKSYRLKWDPGTEPYLGTKVSERLEDSHSSRIPLSILHLSALLFTFRLHMCGFSHLKAG